MNAPPCAVFESQLSLCKANYEEMSQAMIPALQGLVSATLYPVEDDGLLWALGGPELYLLADESQLHSWGGTSGNLCTAAWDGTLVVVCIIAVLQVGPVLHALAALHIAPTFLLTIAWYMSVAKCSTT